MPRSQNQHTHSVTTGLNPGGRIPEGYSYLERSHSLVTPTRRNIPKSMSTTRMNHDSIYSPSLVVLRQSESMSNLKSASTDSPVVVVQKSSTMALRSTAQYVAQLPPNPEFWMPSQVSLYLTHVLGVTPKPIVEDVTAYVRQSRMGGRQFLRLREQILADEGVNVKWRKLMIEAVKKLRKDCVRTRVWPLDYMEQWESEMHRQSQPAKDAHAQSKNTLKRMRDKKAVRDMISNFESIGEGNFSVEIDEAMSPGRLQKRGSISSLHSITSADSSPRFPQATMYDENYHRDRAAKFTNNEQIKEGGDDQLIARRQLEDWFGDLTESEAEALADELDDHNQHRGHLSASSSHSSILSTSESSGRSSPHTPSIEAHAGFDLTPIDAELVMSIVQSMQESKTKDDGSKPTKLALVEALQKDDYLTEDEHDANSQSRPFKAESRTNPYRMSTYDEEDVVALGLYETDSTSKFDTARRITHENEEAIEDIGAAKDSIRVRRYDNSPNTPVFTDLFSTQSEDVATQGAGCTEEVCGEEVTQTSDTVGDIHGFNADRTPSTYGRTSLAAALRAQKIQTSPETDLSDKKAENESEWGITVSRKASRRGTAARSELKRLLPAVGYEETRYNTAASRMSALFNPSTMAELAQSESDAGADHIPRHDQILLPLATLDVEADGSASLRNKSMVLVDRRKFEALSKRMGDLEAQLADMEIAASSTAALDATLSSADDTRLSSIFDGKQHAQQVRKNVAEQRAFNDETAELNHRDWSFALRFGLIPSYALGLAAGAGFVLLSEVFGRGRR